MQPRQPGKHARTLTLPLGVRDLTTLGYEPGIGMVPPEFDAIEQGEQETVDELRGGLHPPVG